MKIADHLRIIIASIAIALATVFLYSCDDDDGASRKITVNQVFLQVAGNTTTVITEARVGTLIRIDGSGFSGLKAVYCNGVKASVNPNFVTDHSILFSLPSENIPVGSDAGEGVRNTIRIVTKSDDYSHPFLIQGSLPVVTGVSHTFAKPGEEIQIYGTNLKDLRTVTFPGDITLTEEQFEVNEEFTAIKCMVPNGVVPGAIMVDGDNGAGYSYDYMFRQECMIITTFAFGDVYNGSSAGTLGSLTSTQSAAIPSSGNPKSPAGYRACPNVIPSTTTLTVSPSAAFTFYFNPKQAAEKVIANSAGLITASTRCADLALQIDIYVPVAWGSGYINIDLKPGTAGYSANASPPWAAGDGAVKDVTMSGWQTVNIPLGTVTALSTASMQDVINTLTGNANFILYNKDYTDAEGAIYTAKPIDNFQIFFGNMRIVPYVKPS